MASSFAISGAVSGFDSTGMIKALMQVEAIPQAQLVNKKANASSLVTALQSLNTKAASLLTAAQTAAKTESWKTVTATSSATSVTTTVGSTAQPSSVTFDIENLAASQSSLVTLPSSFTSTTPSFTLTHGTGPDATTVTVTAASTSAADVAAAFNKADTGVTAAVVNLGTTAVPDYRIQLTGTKTGAAATFSVASNDSADQPGVAQIRAAVDASITLWAGTPAEQAVTSATNTFSGLLGGVDVTLSKAETDPVTLTVAPSTAAQTTLASSLVTNLNTVLSEIASRTKTSTSTAEDGGTIVTGGLFAGNSTTRGLQQNLLAVASQPVDGTSPSDIGLVLNRDGTFTFDSAKYTAALAADPAKVEKIVSTVASRVAEVAKSASDKDKGSITAQVNSHQGIVKDLADRIADWDDRLAMRQATLERTYTAMEVALSTLTSQQAWLSAQIEQLNANSGS
ncbi:flagellar filament capping protein FliD [Actinotalea subterranea]|uniref:flagellar filament capping protein FliD n=1 Tax=Actinotalea subterranea TaxID=2607497 RepID=UPI0011ECD321|nr:flagellar filament capping protein FliD [Actinotalea subterranea]